MTQILKIVGIIVILFALIYGWGQLVSNNSTDVSAIDPYVITDADYVKGNPDADVVIFEYADLECPACAAYHPLVKGIGETYGDRIAIVFRHFPLTQHPNALTAAYAVEAAGKQDKFWEMHDLLFETQSEWAGRGTDSTLFDQYAEQLGLDMGQYRSDLLSRETKKRVQETFALGEKIGVNSTPTFAMNGQLIPNPRSAEEFIALIESELGEKTVQETATTTVTEQATSTQ